MTNSFNSLKVFYMTAHPYISVIIPTFNRAHKLPVTLDHLVCQAFENFEIIIVDDGWAP